MPKLFISYRREDTLPIAGRVDDRLKMAYGRASVFRDIDTIPPGVDFRQHLIDAVSQCNVVLVLIGSRWLDVSHGGQRRLDNPGDFVRIEIEAALARDIPVVPVLVDGAVMPREQDLPPSLGALAYRNAVKVDSGVDFHHHMDRLTRGLDVLWAASRQKASATAKSPSGQETPSSRELPSLQPRGDDVSAVRHVTAERRAGGSRPTAAKSPEPFRPALSLKHGVVLLGLVLLLNSVLAALASVLWEHLPYWPGYMVFALICAYYRAWGVWVAMLSPLVATLLLTGGPAVYLYIAVNLMQALLVLAAFRGLRIDPRLPSWADRLKYLGLAVAAPSFVGGCSAWVLRRFADPDAGDSALLVYALWWTAENLLPAVFPGIWLHRVVGEFYRPFSWGIGGQARSWMTRTFEYATPWMITLLVAGCLVIFMVTEQIGGVMMRPVIWKRVHELSAESALFRGMVLALCVSLLVSLGYAIRYAKQAWLLEQAVRRHLPTRQEAERILTGKTAPSERHLVTIVSISIRAFTSRLAQFRPPDLVAWLNAYFDCVYHGCCQHNGCIDKYTGDMMQLVFGLAGGDTHALDAIRCSLDITEQLPALNESFEQQHLPPISIRIGIHTGLVVSGEIGSRDRRQYAAVGEAAYIACDIERRTEELTADLPSETPPVLISHDTLKEAGLLLDARFGEGYVPIPVGAVEADQPRFLYAIRDRAVAAAMHLESVPCEQNIVS
jgi:class 3 adenylate cyclase